MGIVMFAKHEAVEPPPEPIHDQVQGPVPEVPEYAPRLQKFVVGAVNEVVPFEAPQEPLTTGVFAALHDALDPPYKPRHDQVQGPVPAKDEYVPAVQEPEARVM